MIDATALADTIEWLNDGCPSAPEADQALTELCLRLTGCGVPLIHGAIFARTLHPEIIGRRWIWHPETGVDAASVGHDSFSDPEYRDSPIKYVFDKAEKLRRRLGDPDCPIDFTFLDKFRDEGVTDFFAMPLRASDGLVNASAWMTQAKGGFSDGQLDAIGAIQKPLARLVEVKSLKRVAINLLDTYVGGQAGGRSSAATSGAATSRRSGPRSGSPTCVASPRAPIACRPSIWSSCSTAISIARCPRSAKRAARC